MFFSRFNVAAAALLAAGMLAVDAYAQSQQITAFHAAVADANASRFADACVELGKLNTESNGLQNVDPAILAQVGQIKPLPIMESETEAYIARKDYVKGCVAAYITGLTYLRNGDRTSASRMVAMATMAQALMTANPGAAKESAPSGPAGAASPAACPSDAAMHSNWRVVNPCVKALIAQAQVYQQAGNSAAARETYLRARQVNGIAGMYADLASETQISAGLNQLDAAARPPAKVTAASSASASEVPTGRYTCMTGVSATFLAGGIGRVALNAPQFGGYFWVYDAHHYANEKEDDRGVYTLGPNGRWLDVTGPLKRVGTIATYTLHGPYDKPAIILTWEGTNAGLACQQ